MKTWIVSILLLITVACAQAGNYAGTYLGKYTLSVERLTANGKTYPGGTYTGIKVKARVSSEGRVKIMINGWARFNGRWVNQYIDEVFYGKVDDYGRITMGRNGVTTDYQREIFGSFTLLRKEAKIRSGRMSLETALRTQKLGLVIYDIVAYRN